MGNYVTTTGFKRMTYEEAYDYFVEGLKGILGEQTNFDASGPAGQLAALLAKSASDFWECSQEIYTSRIPSEATGTSLDGIAELTGVRRLDATPTTYNNTNLYGSNGVTITAGSQARQLNNAATFSLVADVLITNTACRDITFDVTNTTPGATVSVTINSVQFDYVVQGGDAKSDIVDGLITAITPGAFVTNGGTATNVSNQLRLTDIVDINAVATANLNIVKVASSGIFICDIDGPIAAGINTLTVIVTPTTGWDSVSNPVEGTIGTNTETDSALRIRRAKTFSAGLATEEAIRQELLNNVEGITLAIVTSNRTDAPVDGKPPKSFEVIVDGNFSDPSQDVGDTIWRSMPAGIYSHGTEEVTVTDSAGELQTVRYSRPVTIPIYVTIVRAIVNPSVYPTNGDELIKQAIVEWSLTNYSLGDDVYADHMIPSIYSVPGIGNVSVTIGTPTYDTQTYIAIGTAQVASFNTANIQIS